MIISIDEEKVEKQTKNPKPFNRFGTNGKYLNIIKAMYDKPTAKIILNREKLKLKAFYLRSGTRQKFPFLSLLLNRVV